MLTSNFVFTTFFLYLTPLVATSRSNWSSIGWPWWVTQFKRKSFRAPSIPCQVSTLILILSPIDNVSWRRWICNNSHSLGRHWSDFYREPFCITSSFIVNTANLISVSFRFMMHQMHLDAIIRGKYFSSVLVLIALRMFVFYIFGLAVYNLRPNQTINFLQDTAATDVAELLEPSRDSSWHFSRPGWHPEDQGKATCVETCQHGAPGPHTHSQWFQQQLSSLWFRLNPSVEFHKYSSRGRRMWAWTSHLIWFERGVMINLLTPGARADVVFSHATQWRTQGIDPETVCILNCISK